ncbi:MAG: hypothetical protein V7K57_24335 [Nostoc sp.]
MKTWKINLFASIYCWKLSTVPLALSLAVVSKPACNTTFYESQQTEYPEQLAVVSKPACNTTS